jgi:hypothetical protein
MTALKEQQAPKKSFTPKARKGPSGCAKHAELPHSGFSANQLYSITNFLASVAKYALIPSTDSGT